MDIFFQSAHFADILDVGLFGTLVQITAYIAPYFLIPAAFRAGMGAFGALSGMINDRSRGLFDRAKKGRQERRAQGWQNFRAGNGSRNALSRSALTRRVGTGIGVGTQGRFGFGQRGQAARTTMDQVNMAEALKDPKSQALALNSDDGSAVMALSGGTRAGAVAASHDLAASWRAGGMSAAAAESRRRDALADAEGAGITRARAMAGGQLMMQNKARAIEGGDWNTVQRGIERLHGGNTRAADSHSQTLRYAAMEGGRSDFASTGEMFQRDAAGNLVLDANGNRQANAGALRAGFDRAGAAKVAGGHTSALRAQANDLVATYQAAIAGGDAAGAFEAATRMTALRNAESAGYTPEENKQIIYDMLDAAGINTGAPEDTANQFGTNMQATFGPGVTAQEITDNVRTRAALFERDVNPNQVAQQNQQQGGGNPPSDIRLKKNIKQLTNISGVQLYSFNYLWDTETTYVGVMAQDLLNTPFANAVVRHSNEGYYRVDYSILGLRMVTLEEWTKNPNSVYLESITQNVS